MDKFMDDIIKKWLDEAQVLSTKMISTTEGHSPAVSYIASLVVNKFLKGEVRKTLPNDYKLDVIMSELEIAADDLTNAFFNEGK